MERDILIEIPIDRILPNPNQPRKEFSEEGLQELADSIREYGVIQPLLVRKKEAGETYELIAGERRLRASKIAGLTSVPAILTETEDLDSAIIAMIENLQRRDLNFFEEAEGYFRLMEDFNMSQVDIAKKMGKNQSTIANKLRLLRIEPEVQEKIKEYQLTERHARAILKLPSTMDKLTVVEEVNKKALNVSDTERLVELKLKSKMFASPEEEPPELRIKGVSRDLRLILNEVNKIVSSCNSLGIPVTMSKENKGKFVEIKLKVPV